MKHFRQGAGLILAYRLVGILAYALFFFAFMLAIFASIIATAAPYVEPMVTGVIVGYFIAGGLLTLVATALIKAREAMLED